MLVIVFSPERCNYVTVQHGGDDVLVCPSFYAYRGSPRLGRCDGNISFDHSWSETLVPMTCDGTVVKNSIRFVFLLSYDSDAG